MRYQDNADWHELDQAAAAHGLGARRAGHQQRLRLWPEAPIWLVLTVALAPPYYFFSIRPIILVEMIVVMTLTWLLIMAIVIGIQLRSIRKRGLRLALYEDGIVVRDGGALHVARWDELSVSQHNEILTHTVNLVFNNSAATSTVGFTSGDWPLARQLTAELQHRTQRP